MSWEHFFVYGIIVLAVVYIISTFIRKKGCSGCSGNCSCGTNNGESCHVGEMKQHTVNNKDEKSS